MNSGNLQIFEKNNRKEFKTIPENFLLSQRVVENAEKIYNMCIRPDDVWVVTPPKCGTTWMQEIVWCLCNNMDFNTAAELNQYYRFPFFNACFSSTFKLTTDENGLTSCSIFGREVKGYGKLIDNIEKTAENLPLFLAYSFEYTEKMPSPRFIKSHLPLSILPKDLNNCKVIYVARNIKDVCVSTYYQKRSPATFEEHATSFKDGDVMIGNWFEHMQQAWVRRNDQNFMFVWYEDMKDNLEKVINDVARFLGKNILEKDIHDIMEYVKVDNFRQNKSVNKFYEMVGKKDFIRKGIVGDWRNHFNEQTNTEWNDWIKTEMERTGLDMRGWK